MTKYEIILYWSEEDQAFIAEVPELPGCAADGACSTVLFLELGSGHRLDHAAIEITRRRER